MTNYQINIVKKIVLTTLLFVTSFILKAGYFNVDSSQRIGTGIRKLSDTSVISFTDRPNTTRVFINAKRVTPEYYIQKDANYTHVDTLVYLFLNKLDNLYEKQVQNEIDYAIQERKRLELKAKIYLSIPISILIWSFLLFLAIRENHKLFINICSILLIASIIGTFVVLPILLVGLNILIV
jgi:hypothetical protein